MDLQTSMLLWIPANSDSVEESDDLTSKVTNANGAVLDFCSSLISLDELLQTVEHYGADVDQYITDLADSIQLLGA